MTYHKSVLTQEVLTYLALKPHGVYIDATFGGGGHTRAILEAEPTCTVIAFDWDTVALDTNGPKLQEQFPNRLQLIWGNFAHIERLLKKNNCSKVDGILADFGTSQHQLLHRPGFSFSQKSPLDMRMSPAHQKTTAYDIVNKATEQELITIFKDYGEERQARQFAQLIIEHRVQERIKTTRDLALIIEKKVRAHPGKPHPATKIFQALRIFVNSELDNIRSFFPGALRSLKPHGRLVCISFHSLEDRMVKQFFANNKDTLSVVTPRVITATEQELIENRSSRSAKLRAAELIKEF